MTLRINQSAIDDESFLFGSLAQNTDYKDGLLTNIIRKASRVLLYFMSEYIFINLKYLKLFM